jgi:hypothetical protein
MYQATGIPWEYAKRAREESELRQIEDRLDHISQTTDGGYISMEAKDNLLDLKAHRNNLIDDKEIEWCLKRRAI